MPKIHAIRAIRVFVHSCVRSTVEHPPRLGAMHLGVVQQSRLTTGGRRWLARMRGSGLGLGGFKVVRVSSGLPASYII